MHKLQSVDKKTAPGISPCHGFCVLTQHRRNDGSICNVETTMAGIWINDKKLRYVSARDITKHKHADEQPFKLNLGSWVKETIAIADKCNKGKSSGNHEI